MNLEPSADLDEIVCGKYNIQQGKSIQAIIQHLKLKII